MTEFEKELIKALKDISTNLEYIGMMLSSLNLKHGINPNIASEKHSRSLLDAWLEENSNK